MMSLHSLMAYGGLIMEHPTAYKDSITNSLTLGFNSVSLNSFFFPRRGPLYRSEGALANALLVTAQEKVLQYKICCALGNS